MTLTLFSGEFNSTFDEPFVATRLKKVEGEISNLVKAIKAGIITATTKEELVACESQREQLKTSLAEGEPSSNVVEMIPKVPERFRAMVHGLGDRATRANPRDNARAQAALFEFLGEVPVESEVVDGVKVPVAVLQGISRAILRVVGAELSALDNCGSGGRLCPIRCRPISIAAVARDLVKITPN